MNKLRDEISRKYKTTPKGILSKGMYCCSDCGKLNPIENQKCCNCFAEKFIIT